MDFEKIKITDIAPAEYNPRVISKDEFEKLSNSINEFGLVDPIIINLKNNKIIGGHQRYDVLLNQYMLDNEFYPELNIIKLGDIGWCFTDTDLTVKSEDHEKALNIALNKISGEWDFEKLNIALEELSSDDFDVELTGFDVELEKFDKDINLTENTGKVIKGDAFDSSQESTSDSSQENKDSTSENNDDESLGIPEDEPTYDETIADTIETIKCPRCGYELPKH